MSRRISNRHSPSGFHRNSDTLTPSKLQLYPLAHYEVRWHEVYPEGSKLAEHAEPLDKEIVVYTPRRERIV